MFYFDKENSQNADFVYKTLNYLRHRNKDTRQRYCQNRLPLKENFVRYGGSLGENSQRTSRRQRREKHCEEIEELVRD